MPEELDVKQTETVPPEGEIPDGGTPPDATDVQAELERTRQALKAANREAADRRKKLEALEQAETARQQAEMTELDRIKASHVDLESKYNALVADYDSLRLRQAFYDAASAAKVMFSSDQARIDAYELSDLSGAFEDGKVDPKALAAVIKDLQKTRPYLFGTATTPVDIGADRRGGSEGEVQVTDDDVKEFAARMGVSAHTVDKRALALVLRARAQAQAQRS